MTTKPNVKKTLKNLQAAWPTYIDFYNDEFGNLCVAVFDTKKSKKPLYMIAIGKESLNSLAEKTAEWGRFPGVIYMSWTYSQFSRIRKTGKLPRGWSKAVSQFVTQDKNSRETWEQPQEDK